MNRPDYRIVLQADHIKRLEEENKELSKAGLEAIKILCQYIINLKQKFGLADETVKDWEPQWNDGCIEYYECPYCKYALWLETGTPKENQFNYCPKCGKRIYEVKND